MNETDLIKKMFSALDKKNQVRIVDILGGVDKDDHLAYFDYLRNDVFYCQSPEITLFRLAKKLQVKGHLRVKYRTGRNWLIRVPRKIQEISLSSLFKI